MVDSKSQPNAIAMPHPTPTVLSYAHAQPIFPRHRALWHKEGTGDRATVQKVPR